MPSQCYGCPTCFAKMEVDCSMNPLGLMGVGTPMGEPAYAMEHLKNGYTCEKCGTAKAYLYIRKEETVQKFIDLAKQYRNPSDDELKQLRFCCHPEVADREQFSEYLIGTF